MKNPPIAKVYEALTAIASNRVEMSEFEAKVYSSDYKKSYKVMWKENFYYSNDNATYWQGYPGYPVIAVLLLQGKLTLEKELLPFLKDINWHALNEKHKRNYDAAIEKVLDSFDPNEKKNIKDSIEEIYKNLLGLDIQIVRKI